MIKKHGQLQEFIKLLVTHDDRQYQDDNYFMKRKYTHTYIEKPVITFHLLIFYSLKAVDV
jgi:hypothetical protein